MLDILGADDVESICVHLVFSDILRLSRVCKQLDIWYHSSQGIHILSLKLNTKNSNLNQLLLRYHLNFIMPILNRLALYYYSGHGFEPQLLIKYDINSKSIINYCITLNNNCNIYLYDEHKRIIHLSSVKDDDVLMICFNKDYLENEATHIIVFSVVIIKYEDETYWDEINQQYKDYIFRYLASRLWILSVEPFIEVTLSSKIKGTYLTIEDILFATQILTVNIYDCIGTVLGYRILSEDNDVLILEPSTR